MRRFLTILVGIGVVRASAATPAPLVARFDFTPDPAAPAHVQGAGPANLGGALTVGASLAQDAVRGPVLHLAGDRTRIELGQSEMVDRLTRRFTVGLWFKLERNPGGSTAPIVTKRPGWWTGKPFSINVRGDGRLEAVVNDGQDGWLHGRPCPLGVWQHAALVVDDDTVTLYQNAAAVDRRDYAGRLRSNTDALALGWEEGSDFPGGDYRGFPGMIDDLTILATSLTPAEVAALRDGRLTTRPATASDLPTRGLLPRAIPAALRGPPPDDAPLEAHIVFTNETPDAVGLWFDTVGVRPATVEVRGRQEPAWVAVQGSSPYPWERAFRFVFTDPRFREGRMPVVDVEIEYLLPAWAGVQVMADTASGSRAVASGWQATEWQTLRFRIDDAWFGARDFGNPESARASDGYDLRINGSTSDLYIRAIRVRGYDRVRDPDFRRLLQLEVVSPNDIFVFDAGEPVQLRYALTNRALRPVALHYRFAWERHAGTPVGATDGRIDIGAAAAADVPLRFPTAELPLGVYVVNATLSAAGASAVPHTLLERTTYVGLVAAGVVDKAADGEFLYGLDTDIAPAFRNPRILRWCDVLGVDIVRAGFDLLHGGSAEIEAGLPRYRAHRLRTQVMLDIPWDEDADQRRAETARRAALAATLAAAYPEELVYWELGNEPDLTFFYPGPIEAYVTGYEQVARAILHANPRAVVMNGGLCFAGPEADRRARRFIELVDPDTIVAWAYHAHGPGAHAERNMLERIRAEAAKWGKADKPFVQTESGFAAGTRTQETIQARTCVQKMVYAQSQGVPAFFWFRLVMSGEDYNTLRGDTEPRPAALAYRAMVQALRHHRFVRTLDLGIPDAEAYLFVNADTRTGRIVFWRDTPGAASVLLSLGDRPEDLHQRDLFGNRREPPMAADGAVRIVPGEDPVFLCWRGAVDASVRVLPALMRPPEQFQLDPGVSTSLSVRVHNPLTRAFAAQLRVAAAPGLPVALPRPEIRVALAPGEFHDVHIPLTAGTPRPPLVWPRGWLVFPDLDLDLTGVTAPPAAGGVALPMRQDGIDIAALGVDYRERRPAVAFAEIFSDAERTVTMGASADWWMAWYVNGAPVYDTLATGNAGAQAIDTHVFPIPLRKGRNVIAVKVLSGSLGWRFNVGSPDDIAQRQCGAGSRLGGLTLTLAAADGGTLDTQHVPVDFVPAPARHPPPPMDLAAWRRLLPEALLGAQHVRNLHEQQPDRRLWYQGDDDLSATVWLHAVADVLVVDVAVRDDRIEALPDGAGDALRLALRPADGPTMEWQVPAAANGACQALPLTAVAAPIGAQCLRLADGVLYRLSVPAALLGEGSWGINVVVRDHDGGTLKQTLPWRSWDAPEAWPRYRWPAILDE